jgi:signal transduction histidine kinase
MHQAHTETVPHRAISVLIVDDNRVDRQRCRRMLQHHPDVQVCVTEAATVDEAEAMCRTTWFDCIIADYELPSRKGTDLARSHRADTDPPVILLTGNGDEVVAMEALQAGVCDYMKKDVLNEKALQRSLLNAVRRSVLIRAVHNKSRELERANEELQKRASEIERFYHTVSHELKTPLTAAREFISLVADEVLGGINVRQRQFLGHALECCDQLAVHFNDLVDTSRLETGKMRLVLKTERIETAILRGAMSLSAIATSRDIVLRRMLPQGLPEVTMDAGRITQVVANLLSNAIKFTDPGGTVQIEATCSEQFVRISIRDSGCGIAAEHLPRIFERLYQVTPAGENMIGAGLGLGLYICCEIVELHGGQLEVESIPGVGSVFSFTVPLAESAQIAPRATLPIYPELLERVS